MMNFHSQKNKKILAAAIVIILAIAMVVPIIASALG